MKGRRSRSVDVLPSRPCVHLDGHFVEEEDDMLHLALDSSEPRAIDGKSIRSPSPLLLDTFSPLTAMRSSATTASVMDEECSDSPLFIDHQRHCCNLLSCKHALMLTLALVLLTIPLSLITSVILMRDNNESKNKQPQIVYVEEQDRTPFFWELDQWATKSKEELDQEIMRLEIRKQLMEELYRNAPLTSTSDPEWENLQRSFK
uniref:Transmembrane protein n=1 Tax=Plectus sambesii TaxID=2011161 RepID=A0A914WPS5_9BILA